METANTDLRIVKLNKLEPLNSWKANIRFIKYTYESKQIKKKTEYKTAK